MKKLAAISLFIFAIALTAVFSAGLLSYEKNKTNTTVTDQPANSNASTVTEQQVQLPNAEAGQKIVLSQTEITKHNKAKDCWLLINNKIYDVTNYINQHPGGANEILNSCGQDATLAFQTKGGRGNDHSQAAYTMLAPYYIGSLNQTLNTATSVNTDSKTTPKTITGSKPTATSQSTTTQNSNTVAPAANVALTVAEITKHNKTSDCWLLISNKVYNVTSYINSHPGGAGEIIRFCGQDATTTFQTKGGQGNNHSTGAYNILGAYYIGDLNQNLNQAQLNNSVQNTSAVQPPAGGGENEEESEFEDD